MVLTIILLYLAIAAAVPLWDAYIGFGFEFPRIEDGPNAVCAGLFWPIGIPIILVIVFSNLLSNAKDNRLKREHEAEKRKKDAERLRIAAEKEQEEYLREVEEEILHERKGSHRS